MIALSIWSPALADVVRMKSGDVVSGKIKEISDDELVIDPDFTDPIDIKLKYIASIETSQAVTVEFHDGREATGFVELGPDGEMSVRRTPTRWDDMARKRRELLGMQAEPPPNAPEREPLTLASIQELEPAVYRYEATIGLGFNASSGNSDSSALALDGTLDWYWGPNSMGASWSANRRESDGELDAEDWRVSLRYERELRGKWLAWGATLFEANPFQELNLRSVVALGGGYQFYDSASRDLAVFLGPAWARENFSGSAFDQDYVAAIWSFDFEQDLWTPDVTLYHQHRLIKAVDRGQFVASAVQGLKFDLFGDLDLKLEFQFDHTAEPPPGVSNSNDYRYLVKLDYEFEGDELDWFH